LSQAVAGIPRGAPYVLTLLTPHAAVLDTSDFDRALAQLMGDVPLTRAEASPYEMWAGVAGEAPTRYRAARRPFRESVSLVGDDFEVRLDAWLPFDTFRRGGFGHVRQGRRRLLAIERGVSLLWIGPDGAPHATYAAGLYAPRPRFRIPASIPQQAHGTRDAMLGIAAPAE
jgi:hypothetical protein